MKRIALVALLTLSCASNTQFTMRKQGVSVKYETYQDICAELESKAQLHMWEPEELEEKKNMWPKGGRIKIEVTGITIGSVGGSSWEFIITDTTGKILQRSQMRESLPNYTTMNYNSWYNFDIVSVDDSIKPPFLFHAVDGPGKRKITFDIR